MRKNSKTNVLQIFAFLWVTIWAGKTRWWEKYLHIVTRIPLTILGQIQMNTLITDNCIIFSLPYLIGVLVVSSQLVTQFCCMFCPYILRSLTLLTFNSPTALQSGLQNRKGSPNWVMVEHSLIPFFWDVEASLFAWQWSFREKLERGEIMLRRALE